MPRRMLREATATATSRNSIRSTLALVLSVVVVTAIPAWADTSTELDAAKDRLETARAELTRVTGLWQETEARLARAQDAASQAQAEIDRLEDELARIRSTLNDRVAAAYMSGGSLSIGALLTSDSIQDATDRLQYTQSVVQGDADLATHVALSAEELRRQEARLRQAARLQAKAAAELEAERQIVLDRHVRVEGVVLEHHRDVAVAGREPGDLTVADPDVTLGHLLEAGDHPQQRRLAAAGGPDEDHELAALDRQTDVVDRANVAVVDLSDLLEPDLGHVRAPHVDA